MISESKIPKKIILPMNFQEPGSQRWDWGLSSFRSKFIYIVSLFMSCEGTNLQAVVPPHPPGVLEALEIMSPFLGRNVLPLGTSVCPYRVQWLWSIKKKNLTKIEIIQVIKSEFSQDSGLNLLLSRWLLLMLLWYKCIRCYLGFHLENSISIHTLC